tara:strand:- start:1131 stop:1583 length:453 start_codon:yes stop_codon:yes gene_type:complete
MTEETNRTHSKYLSSLSTGAPKERELTERQQSFLDNLIHTGGDPKKAAELAGYAEGSYSQVIKSLKTEIIELASQILAQSAPKAAIKLVDVMESEQPIPQASVRLQAAQTILDRIGLGKTDRLDVNHTSSGGIFILPAKGEVIDGEYSEA